MITNKPLSLFFVLFLLHTFYIIILQSSQFEFIISWPPSFVRIKQSRPASYMLGEGFG